MLSPETPMSFRESLPPEARDWVWLPKQTVTLTLDSPAGGGTIFHVRYAPYARMLAYNVAQLVCDDRESDVGSDSPGGV